MAYGIISILNYQIRLFKFIARNLVFPNCPELKKSADMLLSNVNVTRARYEALSKSDLLITRAQKIERIITH